MTNIELDENELQLELFLVSESESTTVAELAALYTEAPE